MINSLKKDSIMKDKKIFKIIFTFLFVLLIITQAFCQTDDLIQYFTAGLPVTLKDNPATTTVNEEGMVGVPITCITKRPADCKVVYHKLSSTTTTTKSMDTSDGFFHSYIIKFASTNTATTFNYQIKALERNTPASSEVASATKQFKKFRCGDGVCDRYLEESEFLCATDCRTGNSCENVVGAWTSRTEDSVKLASELGVRFNVNNAADIKIEPYPSSIINLGSSYEIDHIVRLTNHLGRMRLSQDIDATTTVIPVEEGEIRSGYAPFTKKSPIPLPAVFSIEWEEVQCNGFDITNSAFTGCVRGYNGTTATSHLENTYCLAHQELVSFLESIKDYSLYPRVGYYLIDDRPEGFYLPALQKMYQIIKNYEYENNKQNPVFVGCPGGVSSEKLIEHTSRNSVFTNTGLGSFDAFFIYVYPMKDAFVERNLAPEDATSHQLANYKELFYTKLGYVPPFIGLYQGFYDTTDTNDNGLEDFGKPTLDLIKGQIDTYFSESASAISFFNVKNRNTALQNAFNNKELRQWVADANQYAVQKYCPSCSLELSPLSATVNTSTIPKTITANFKPNGSFDSY
ncbi:MAG: hypothetical protein NC828_06850, partial [Candidatus Omnitrophica bacterium]|nr:hypothetical protein [Candidatus Omnitrophota bacterium]